MQSNGKIKRVVKYVLTFLGLGVFTWFVISANADKNDEYMSLFKKGTTFICKKDKVSIYSGWKVEKKKPAFKTLEQVYFIKGKKFHQAEYCKKK